MGQGEVRIEFREPDNEVGAYSNIMRVWHSPFDFTLDFGVAGPVIEDGDEMVLSVPTVARIKIPVSVIFQLARAIADNVARYETEFGPISPAGNAPDSPGGLEKK